ncbi:MAG TPA: acyl-CoA dehydrogenase family protein [Thermoplasmata archaeon]|nr:acyl-CoA dehydrogenase family protein [Thermoplasmata archaeon]
MDFDLSDEQRLFQSSFREWCDKNLVPRSREIDTKHRIPDDVIDGLAEQGIFGLGISEEFGGSNASILTCALAVEEVARGDISVATAVLTLLNIGWSNMISRHGHPDLKAAILPQVAKAKNICGIATTEPKGGSDLANIASTAVRKGDQWVCNGEKVYISEIRETLDRGGGYCTLLRTDPAAGTKGMSFVFVPLAAPGIQTTVIHNMGRMGLSTGGFVMNETPIPLNYTLGEINNGFKLAMEGFNIARILVAAACLGCAERALELGSAHIKTRKLFGQPIGKFEGISFEFADFEAMLHASRLLVYRAAWTADQYLAGKKDIHQLALASAMSKLVAPVDCYKIADGVMTWFGALGYSQECDIEMGVRGVRSYSVGAEGAQNVMRMILIRELLGEEFLPYK